MQKLFDYIPFQLLIFLILGILIQWKISWWKTAYFSLFWIFPLIFCLLFVVKKYPLFIPFSWLFFLLLGIYLVFENDMRNHEKFFAKPNKEDTWLTLEITEVLKSNTFSDRYEAKVLRLNSKEVKGHLLVAVQKDSITPILNISDQIVTNSTVVTVNSPRNPDQFNYKEYLARRGIHHQLYLNSTDFRVIGRGKSILSSIAAVRSSLQKSLRKEGFTKDQYAVITALLLGQRQEVSSDLLSDYSKAGAIHILAISGLHVGILLLLLNALLKSMERMRYGKEIKLVLVVLFLWFFALLAGMSASVIRAVTMFSAVALGQFVHRRNSVTYSLIFSMFVLLLFNPMLLFDVGFQLSYAAVYGIVSIQPKLYSLWSPNWKVLDKIWQLSTVSIAAQIAVLPLSLYYFHQFPALFLLSNLVIVPFLGILLMGGIIVLILSAISLLPSELRLIYGSMIQGMNDFVQWVAGKEEFLMTQIPFSLWMMMSVYLMILFLYRLFLQPSFQKLFLVGIGLIIIQGVVLIESYRSHSSEGFIVFHANASSKMVHRKGRNMIVYGKIDQTIQNYAVSNKLKIFKGRKADVLQYNKHTILLVDSLGVFDVKGLNSPIIILKDAPKINLERLIQEIKPIQIVADGSNYKSSVEHWKTTCSKTKTPFWSTYQNGAYQLFE